MLQKSIRVLALILCACMLIPAIASCGSPTESPAGTETQGQPENPTESETNDPGHTDPQPVQGEVAYPDGNIQRAVWTKENGIYRQSYTVNATEGTRTTFQTSTGYSGSFAIPTDSVMVYGTSAERFKAWKETEAYTVDMMIAVNRAEKTSYLDALPDRYKDVQTDAAGGLLEHPAGGSYYMVPTKRWTPYVWNMLDSVAKTYHPSMIVLEEPELFHRSGFSEGFKTEWKDYYGEDWEDPRSSPEAAYKSMRLKVYLFERLIGDLGNLLKENYPDIKLVVATHSTVNYNNWNIVSGMNHYLKTGALSGIIGQTWSDTVHSAFPFSGIQMNDEYTNAYLEYASYVNSVPDDLFYALADPMSDARYAEKASVVMYRQTLAAQLMVPEIQRFQVLPWVNRAFTEVSPDYKAVQLGIFNMLNEISGKDVVIEAGTPGVTYLFGDSSSWQSVGDDWALTSSAGMFGVTMPLIYAGIPMRVACMDRLTDPSPLSNASVLIVSYDQMLPEDERVNQAIADWVKAGGVLLYVSGHTDYWDLDGMFWSGKGSPLQDLLDRLGSKVKVKTDVKSGIVSWASEYVPYNTVEDKSCLYGYGRFANTFEGGNTIVTFAGSPVAVEETIGKGHVILCGLPSAYFSSAEQGTDLMRALTEYALEYTDYDYVETNLVTVRRGRFLAAHALDGSETLTGSFIDLFDPTLTVVHEVKIAGGDSAVLVDVEGLDLSKPRLLYTAGTLKEAVTEQADMTVLTYTAAEGAMVPMRFSAPEGLYPTNVTAECGGKTVDIQRTWDREKRSLLLTGDGSVKPVTVTVTWTSEPMESDRKLNYVSFSVETNNKNLDADYIYENTARVNDNLRFCDLSGYIIYEFDTTDMLSPEYQFFIFQNYYVEISEDLENWILIADYSQGGTVPHLKTGGNDIALVVRPRSYGFEDIWYLRLSNTKKTEGWGGSIKSISWKYGVPADDEDPEPDDPVDYSAGKLDVVRDRPMALISDRADQDYDRTVKCNNTNEDLPFLIYNTAGVNANIRYADGTGKLIYAFDISNMDNAEFYLSVVQNYIVEVSEDGEDWTLIADYSEGGTVPHITTGGNGKTLQIRPDEYDIEDVLYIRIRNTDVTKGWGGSIRQIRWTYTAIETMDYEPN